MKVSVGGRRYQQSRQNYNPLEYGDLKKQKDSEDGGKSPALDPFRVNCYSV